MTHAVQKWGDSLVLRIPAAIASEMHIKRGTPVTLRQDSFDAGKQSWWDESWTNGSKWNLTSTGSYSGSAAQCSTANGTSQSALVTRVDTSTLESLRLSFRYKLTNVLDAQDCARCPGPWVTHSHSLNNLFR